MRKSVTAGLAASVSGGGGQCIGNGQRLDRDAVFAAEVQGHPAGDQNRELWACGQQLGEQGSGREEVLEVVEEDEHRARAQGGDDCLPRGKGCIDGGAEHGNQRGDDLLAIAQGRQVDEGGTVGKFV